MSVAVAQHGERLDRTLAELVPEFSRSYLQQLLGQGLVTLNGREVSKPSTRVKAGDAVGVNQALLRQGVIVRPIAAYGMPHWLRVSIGLPEENARFIGALKQALA